ncbi:MAG: hypothetical protein AB7T22_13455 [Calditrichaceae bacterium]
MKKPLIIGAGVVVLAVAVFFLWPRENLKDKIVIPYIAHQKPVVDPHLPNSVPLSDKLDEVLFDGLFNVSANPSGITYEDGLGEFIDIDQNNVVTLRLKPNKKWHDSYLVTVEDEKISVSETADNYFSAKDLNFTLRRIQRLGSLSPDYILVSQALERMEFSGPDENNEIRFQFKGDRIWTEPDIKEVLSFKILPAQSELSAPMYSDGTGPYMAIAPRADVTDYYKNPNGNANLTNVILKPYIDNSTYTTELKNGKINVLLSTPFGSLSPVLSDSQDFFVKSNISTTYFAVLFNTERLSVSQRHELRKLLDNRKIMNRFFKSGTEQQRHIVDYKGNSDNYNDYLNFSMFPSSSYYVEEQIVMPLKNTEAPDLSVLPDTIKIQASLNYGFREEYTELIEILNDPTLFKGRVKATAVQNEEIRKGNYDALLIAVSGYKSNFLFDLYDLFLREPDLSLYKINLITDSDGMGNRVVNLSSFENNKNFFRLDLTRQTPEYENVAKLLDYIYGFMSTREIGDKQAYAKFIDEIDQDMALGAWLFSLPSTAYFRTQFDSSSIDLYGVASQLSTIEKWKEQLKK